MVFTLSDMQNKAVKSTADWYSWSSITPGQEAALFYLAGYAGTGKTSILPFIISALGIDYADVAFCAPTGKAAKVMGSKLADVYGITSNVPTTIHKLIYVPNGEAAEAIRTKIRGIQTMVKAAKESTQLTNDEKKAKELELTKELKKVEKEFDKAKRDSDRFGPSFSVNPSSILTSKKLIICDEASMVGEEIAEDLRAYGIPVLAIGDPFQLPPVGAKPGLTVGDPDFFLTEIHRQALDNPIIRLTMDIRNGKYIKACTMGDSVHIVRRQDDEWTLNPEYDAQVIVGTHKRRWSLTNRIRNMCGYYSNAPEEGEPLMVYKNSKKFPGLVNGSEVMCSAGPGELYEGDAHFDLSIIDDNGASYRIVANQSQFEEHTLRKREGSTAPKYEAFDSRRRDEILDWGWCITGHKSQGSQWDNVIVHDESPVFRQDAERWLYTCASRAAEQLIIVL